MTYLKQFFNDFLNQPKHLFFRKYFLLPVIVFLGWITLGSVFERSYETKDLIRISGRVISIQEVTTKVIDKPAYKGKEQELRIYLSNSTEYFRLTDSYNYQHILNLLNNGDTVQIYIRKSHLVPLGMGKQTDIYQLEQQGKVLFDLRERKQSSKGITIIGAISTLGFLTFYLYHKRKVKQSLTKFSIKVS